MTRTLIDLTPSNVEIYAAGFDEVFPHLDPLTEEQAKHLWQRLVFARGYYLTEAPLEDLCLSVPETSPSALNRWWRLKPRVSGDLLGLEWRDGKWAWVVEL